MKKIFWNEYISIGAMVIGIASLILSMVVPGPQGPAGIPGSNGINGSNGTNGVDGSNGVNGSNGIDGEDGQDGVGIEFQIIDGVMMYRLGEEGEWLLFPSESSSFDLRNIEDERFQYDENDFFLNDFDFRELDIIDQPIIFDTVGVDQQAYVNTKVNEGYIPIASVEDFLSINDDLTERYILTSNLDFNEAVFENSLIGYFDTTLDQSFFFEGVFDGGGYTISNIEVSTSDEVGGIFAGVAYGGSIGNLHLDDIVVATNLEDDSYGYGILMGVGLEVVLVESVTITNSTVYSTGSTGLIAGSMYGFEDDLNDASFGGLFHRINATNNFLAISTINSGYSAGGLVGSVYQGSHYIINNHVTNLLILESQINTAGLVGYVESAELELLFNTVTSLILDTEFETMFAGFLLGSATNSYLNIISNTIELSSIEMPGAIFVGGIVGHVVGDIYMICVANTLIENSIEGLFFVGGMLGGSSDEEMTHVMLYSVQNTITGTIIGLENVGGMIGVLFFGSLYFELNEVSLTFDVDVLLGGLVGYVGDQVYIRAYQNILTNTFQFNVNIVPDTTFYSNYLIGGFIGSTGENSLGLFANNHVQTTLQYVLDVATLPENENLSVSMYSMGGMIGSLGDQSTYYLRNGVVQTYVTFTHRFGGAFTGINFSVNHHSLGGVVGFASGLSSRLFINDYRILFDVHNLYEGLPASIGSTTHSIGGVVGNAEGLQLELIHGHVIFDYTFDPMVSTSSDNRIREAFMNKFGFGGIIGYVGDYWYSTITLDYVQIDMDITFNFGKNPLLLGGIVVFSLDDVGSLIGIIESSLSLVVSDSAITLNVNVSETYLTFANILNQSTNEEGFLQLSDIGGFIGITETFNEFVNVIFQRVLLQFEISENLNETFFEDGFYSLMSRFYSNSINVYGVDSFVYSNVEKLYGEGAFFYVLAQPILTEAEWLDHIETYARDSIFWTFVNNQLYVRFLDPTIVFRLVN